MGLSNVISLNKYVGSVFQSEATFSFMHLAGAFIQNALKEKNKNSFMCARVFIYT